MGVDFERLEVPLEAKRERLEDFIVVELYVSERVKERLKGFRPSPVKGRSHIAFSDKESTVLC